MSPVDIGNLALDAIAARATVTSIFPPDGSLPSNVLNRQYLIRMRAIARSAYWNCLRYQGTLTLLKAWPGTPENPSGITLPYPPGPWLYEYEKPSDSLAERFIVPLLPMPNVSPPLTTAGGVITPPYMPGRVIEFQVATDTVNNVRTSVILTNMSQAQMVYTADYAMLPDLWDDLYKQAAVNYLASFICSPITGKDQKIAFLSAQTKDLVLQARVRDGNEGPTQSDFTPEWLRVRDRSSGLLNNVPWVAPWAGLSFADGGWLGP